MISYLSGIIIHKFSDSVLVDVNQIGYRVYLPADLLADLNMGDEAKLFTHQYIRESSSELFGLISPDQLNFFELLLSISGIGPKSALGILSVAKVADIKKAILSEDASILTVVSGIGPKTAQRIILELKNKVKKEADQTGLEAFSSTDKEVIDGLVSLGYSVQQARQAVSKLSVDSEDISDKLKEALKHLSK
ncbi:MAG TPA: Holliday junction branch migration protein RuvA [Patescibacteria group bacterium]